MKLTLGYSSCPNDAFIFDALIHQRIDTEGLMFEEVIEDVEALNQKALNSVLDISKLSFHAFGHVWDDYVLLNSGSALGRGCGPLLISKEEDLRLIEHQSEPIAIPGRLTTANFLLSLAYPEARNKVEMVFSEIEDAVLSESVKFGLIIHENRFTYAGKGLYEIIDLGEFWEEQTNSPIPLGGIVIKRTLDEDIQHKVDRVIRRSIEFAFANPNASRDYVRSLSQEMDIDVCKQHIDLYVNNFSVDLGEEGRLAIKTLFDKAVELNIFEPAYRSGGPQYPELILDNPQ